MIVSFKYHTSDFLQKRGMEEFESLTLMLLVATLWPIYKIQKSPKMKEPLEEVNDTNIILICNIEMSNVTFVGKEKV